MAESALRALVPRPQEIVAPTRSWNPLNPAFRDTLSSAMTNMLGASNVAGREGYDRSRYADMLTGAVDFVPGAGEAAGVGDVRREVQQGNYLGAALAGVATALGAIPVIGDVAGKAVRGGAPSAIRSVSQVVEDAVKSIPGLKLDVYGTPERGYTISRIEVPKDLRNTGLGTSVIRSITQAADQEGARLMLSPTSDFGGNKNRLEKFYRRLGFTSNSGRAKDFTTMETMIRPPSVASGIAGNALDMSQAARMQRATNQERPFNVNQEWYIGTPVNIESTPEKGFRASKTENVGRDVIFGTDSPLIAEEYSRGTVSFEVDPITGKFPVVESHYRNQAPSGGVYRVFSGAQNPKIINAEGKKWFQIPMNNLTSTAFDEGHDAVIYENIIDSMYGSSFPSNVIVWKNPSDVRSVNAAFDPSKRSSGELLASLTGGAVGLSALNQLVPRNEERRPD